MTHLGLQVDNSCMNSLVIGHGFLGRVKYISSKLQPEPRETCFRERASKSCLFSFLFRVTRIISICYNWEWEMTQLRASYLIFALAPNTSGQRSSPCKQNGRCFCNWPHRPRKAHTLPSQYSRPSLAPVATLAASRWTSSAAMELTAGRRPWIHGSSPTDRRQRRAGRHIQVGKVGAILTLWRHTTPP